MQRVPTPQVVIAVGFDAQNNVTLLYTGLHAAAAQDAIHSAGEAGSISIGYLYENPPATLTLRYGQVRCRWANEICGFGTCRARDWSQRHLPWQNAHRYLG
jgi:hypothetical protein